MIERGEVAALQASREVSASTSSGYIMLGVAVALLAAALVLISRLANDMGGLAEGVGAGCSPGMRRPRFRRVRTI